MKYQPDPRSVYLLTPKVSVSGTAFSKKRYTLKKYSRAAGERNQVKNVEAMLKIKRITEGYE